MPAVKPSCAFLVLALIPGVKAQPPDVRPIFEKSCYGCHGPRLQSAGLRLDTKPAKVIVPGDAAGSILYQRIAGIGDQARMPMGGKPLDPAQIAIIKSWIDKGAEWSEATTQTTSAKHWAFIPPVRAPLPKASQPNWVRNPIDNFILAKLDAEKLQPSAEADRVTLFRRLSLDLIGLPPTPEEIDAFLNDKTAKAYETQVDRLL